MPAGIEVLARVRYAGPPFMYGGNVFLPETIERVVGEFNKEFFPGYPISPISRDFFSVNPKIWLISDQQGAEHHLGTSPTGEAIIYVPQWFEDFKTACKDIYVLIMGGQLEDIEVLKMGDA